MLSHIGSTRIALPGLLLVSLVLNGFLLLRAPASATQSDVAGNQRSKAASAYRAGALDQCQRQLHIHRLRAVHLTRKQLAALQHLSVDPANDEALNDEPPPDDSSFDSQQQMLCSLGLEELRRNWELGSDLIHNNLTRDLASPDAQAADLNRTLTGLGDALNLSGAQLSQLEKRYVPLRSRRVQTALVALESDPPDYLAAFDEALDLYQDTDSMVRDLYGDSAVDKVRGAELRRRTHVLAVLASLADVSWDSSIEW